jgi:hypothetical protein
MRINGFDERYEAPGIGEDTDIQFRLELQGVRVKSLNQMAVQYHLFHPVQKRSEKNQKIFEEVKKNNVFHTSYGIVKSNELRKPLK